MHYSEIAYVNSQYPDQLREISHPPGRLWVAGKLRADIPLIAIVGSRKLSEYGQQVTYSLASELAAAGVGIVSGLALGADTIAHQAALEAGGYTVAVLGSGLECIYPASNRGLAQQIVQQGGAVITEQPPQMKGLKHHFPARNRIIAGLSRAVIVTEAAVTSGSLITASFGVQYNRDVMAVPGMITQQQSAGCNNLIRRGAKLITGASDILDELNLDAQITLSLPSSNNQEEAQILDLLARGASQSHELITQSQLSASRFAQIMSLLEIRGTVRNLGSGRWVLRRGG